MNTADLMAFAALAAVAVIAELALSHMLRRAKRDHVGALLARMGLAPAEPRGSLPGDAWPVWAALACTVLVVVVLSLSGVLD